MITVSPLPPGVGITARVPRQPPSFHLIGDSGSRGTRATASVSPPLVPHDQRSLDSIRRTVTVWPAATASTSRRFSPLRSSQGPGQVRTTRSAPSASPTFSTTNGAGASPGRERAGVSSVASTRLDAQPAVTARPASRAKAARLLNA